MVNGFAIKAKWNLIGQSGFIILRLMVNGLIGRIAGKNGGITGFYQRLNEERALWITNEETSYSKTV